MTNIDTPAAPVTGTLPDPSGVHNAQHRSLCRKSFDAPCLSFLGITLYHDTPIQRCTRDLYLGDRPLRSRCAPGKNHMQHSVPVGDLLHDQDVTLLVRARAGRLLRDRVASRSLT